MAKCDPVDGGCWYCYDDSGEMLFSFEFDTYLHEACLLKEHDCLIREGWSDLETEIMFKELIKE